MEQLLRVSFSLYKKSIFFMTCSHHTRDAYTRDVYHFINFLIDYQYTFIDTMCVRRYVVLLSEQAYKPNSINRFLVAISHFVKYIRRYEPDTFSLLFDDGITITMGAGEHVLPHFFFEKQLDTLFNVSPQTTGDIRDYAMLRVLYSTGCRVSELVAMDYSEQAIQQRCFRVVGKGKRERFVFIGDNAYHALLRYQAVRSELLKKERVSNALWLSTRGNRCSTTAVYRCVKKWAQLQGVSAKASPHSFRHSYATHAFNNGASTREVQDLLGHASIASTQRYVHVSVEHMRLAYRKAHPHARRVGINSLDND